MAKIQSKRARLSIDLPPEGRRRIRVAAARKDMSIRKYVLEAVEDRLKVDLSGEGHNHLFSLTADADPVLAKLWDNPRDAAYDRL